MSMHELVLLSPYKFPAQYAMTLSDEDMAAWLNGFTALWHPALLWQTKSLPRCEATYDHETPKAGYVYALPECPPAYLPDDWEARVKQAGAIVFKSTPDRAATLANLKAALSAEGAPEIGWKAGLDRTAEELGPFFGLGWGHQMLASLCEAMEHENLLDQAGFNDDIQQAIAQLGDLKLPPKATGETSEKADPPSQDAPPPPATDWRTHLANAAAKILSAREVLYPVTIHLLDVSFLDDATLAHGWPAGIELGNPMSFVADAATLEKLQSSAPERFAKLQEAAKNELAEICGGSYLEREESILPLDSQLWNLRQGLNRAKALGFDIRIYARRRFGYHPQLPLLLTTNGLTKSLFLTFDENAGLPHYSNVVVSWPSPDGKQVDAFARQPRFADSVETFFNLGHYWFKTTREDHSATLFLMHRDKPTAVWYRDIIELARLAPILGKWTTFSRYLGEVMPGEYPSTMTADDFHFDYLSERITAQSTEPVGALARHHRTRRRIDACWTYAALHRSLSGIGDKLDIADALTAVEKEAETTLGVPAALDDLEKRIAGALAERLQSRAEANKPGYMILNPCAFARRAALELEAGAHPLPTGGVVKACQLEGGKMRAVIEIPALGFAWLPREGPPGTPPMTLKLRVADPQAMTIRNDVVEVEVDPVSGGLKVLRDYKSKINRLGQMLVFNPGSKMLAKEIKVTSSGPTLAEIVSEGFLVGEKDQVLASFRQRFRLWMGRPLLEMRVEITPQQPPAGYGWHAYFGARFAWRDERATLVRGFNGMGYITQHPRPQSPDYLDIRTPPENTTIFTAGLPFHQKQGGRMVDVILIPEGEKTTTFDFGIAVDREVPAQTAWGYASPLAIVPTTKGPPHIGASGWLFHVDASNLLMTRMMPGKMEGRGTRDEGATDLPPSPHRERGAGGEGATDLPPSPHRGRGAGGEGAVPVEDAITARFVECANYSGLAEFRCVRDPVRATILDARGQFVLDANRSGDTVHLEVTPNDLVHLQVEFSVPVQPQTESQGEPAS
jgi:hypothetical protein